jgi:toll-interacting protein
LIKFKRKDNESIKMAASLTPQEQKNMDRRQRIVLQLPPDFLRVNSPHHQGVGPRPPGNLSQQQQETLDEQAAYALHHQLNAAPPSLHGAAMAAGQSIKGRLLISVMQAKLVKNYGMTRMDPYVRIHIGHNIYETPTDVNGSKTPRWNKTIQCFLPHGIKEVYLEIYDECSFSVDELVAHANLQIPEEIFKGETIEEWYNLSGKQGDGKEGQILLVFSFMATPAGSMAPPMHYPPSVTVHGGGGVKHMSGPMVFQTQTPVSAATGPPAPAPPPPTFSEEDFKQLKELFPDVDEEVVKSIYEAQRYNKDGTANAILSMSE